MVSYRVRQAKPCTHADAIIGGLGRARYVPVRRAHEPAMISVRAVSKREGDGRRAVTSVHTLNNWVDPLASVGPYIGRSGVMRCRCVRGGCTTSPVDQQTEHRATDG
jgi:hypothetical protein